MFIDVIASPFVMSSPAHDKGENPPGYVHPWRKAGTVMQVELPDPEFRPGNVLNGFRDYRWAAASVSTSKMPLSTTFGKQLTTPSRRTHRWQQAFCGHIFFSVTTLHRHTNTQ